VGKQKVSVIVPYVREWPQIAFTLRSIHEALVNVDHEVLAIDNLQSTMKEDRGSKNVASMAKEWTKTGNSWLRYFHYTDKLSHWHCKNFGMLEAKGDIYWFIDSHCIMPHSAEEAVKYYQQYYKELNGSLHMPLTYHILEPRQLMYKAVVEVPKSDYHYTFHTLSQKKYEKHRCIEVPAMSTCGMIIHKSFMDEIGAWPDELGIYGGGENFMNYVMAVLGQRKHVWIGDSLCHHGDKRGYAWNSSDYQRNRGIATYMFGGRRNLHTWMKEKSKLVISAAGRMERDILSKCKKHRAWIKAGQIWEIEEWVDRWKGHELLKGDY
jgi:glycosyltransferase involved in cell wall biosynthesis